MYCSNCGQEATGNFCSNCGHQINIASATPVKNYKDVVKINNVDVDMLEVVNLFGNGRIKAIKYIRDITGADLKESKDAVDKYFDTYYGKSLSFSEKRKLKKEQEAKKFRELGTKKRKLDEQDIVYCPKCASTSLSAGKKGLDVGSAIFGASLFGTIGLMAGAGDTESIKVTCLKCGHQFKAGKIK